MKGILVYQPPDKPAQLPEFIDSLDPRLREKIIMQLYQLSKPHKPELREPHFKRFSLERYRDLCELRVKSKMLVRIIFYFCPNGQVLLLHGFIKRQKRDTMQALEQAIRIGYAKNGMPDYGANQMYQSAKDAGTLNSDYGSMDTMPEIIGLMLWKEGHVGVYIGGGYVIEAMGTKKGVVKTELEGRGWQGWCKLPYIDYLEVE